MSYDVFNILIGKGYVWIRNTSTFLSYPNIYAGSLSLVTYTARTALFVETDICSTCPKRGNSNCVGQDYCETLLCDVQIANSINRRARGEQSSIQDFVR